jgi:hypothetical protein
MRLTATESCKDQIQLMKAVELENRQAECMKLRKRS